MVPLQAQRFPCRVPSGSSGRNAAQPSTTHLEMLRAELREYGHRMVDFRWAAGRTGSNARERRSRELAELGFTRVFIAETLEQPRCKACPDSGRAGCPLMRLWKRTRARIDKLEEPREPSARDRSVTELRAPRRQAAQR